MIVTEEHTNEAHRFYKEALAGLHENKSRFMLGGAFALFHYTGIYRDTKDLDIFCTSGEYTGLLNYFSGKGYKTEITDARWLAKVFKDEYFIDIIFNSPNNICRIDDSWYQYAEQALFAGTQVLLIPPEELVWCKIYVQNRERFDGADVNHILLRYGKKLDWKRLFQRVEPDWPLLLAQLLNFYFVYPADFQELVPQWLFEDLLHRASELHHLPVPVIKVCRGPWIDQTLYGTDIKLWNYMVATIRSV
jgi:hypothetical protein